MLGFFNTGNARHKLNSGSHLQHIIQITLYIIDNLNVSTLGFNFGIQSWVQETWSGFRWAHRSNCKVNCILFGIQIQTENSNQVHKVQMQMKCSKNFQRSIRKILSPVSYKLVESFYQPRNRFISLYSKTCSAT